MGQKVNPHGLRVGIIKDRDAKWYAEKDFADNLVEDVKIRKFIKKRLYDDFCCQSGAIVQHCCCCSNILAFNLIQNDFRLGSGDAYVFSSSMRSFFLCCNVSFFFEKRTFR